MLHKVKIIASLEEGKDGRMEDGMGGRMEGWKERKNSQATYTANTLLDCFNSILWLESWIILKVLI